MAGGEVPPGHALRGLEVWGTSLSLRQLRPQDSVQGLPSAKVAGKVGAPTGPQDENVPVRDQDLPRLQRSLPSVLRPHRTLGRGAAALQSPRRRLPAGTPPHRERPIGTLSGAHHALDRGHAPPDGPAEGIWRLAGSPRARAPDRQGALWRTPQNALHHLGRGGGHLAGGPRQALWEVPGAPQTYLEGRRSPPTLLLVEVWRVADQPARDRPHSNLVGPSHLLRRPQD